LLYKVSNIWLPTWTGGNIFWFLFNTANAERIELVVPFDFTQSWWSYILKPDLSYTGTELSGFNKSFYDTMDNIKNMENTGIKWLYTIAIWGSILIVLIAIIALFLMSLSSKKNW
jgi:hypothetical protein